VSALETEGEGVMGTDTMGRVTVRARFENVGHHAMVERGIG
jgi:hypothetical protein